MPDDVVSEVRARTDVAELIGRYVPLKKTGRTFKGLCPFHKEKTPSFIVFPESGTFHCFGCGKGGDVLTFYQEVERIPFREALEELGKRVGVEIRSGPPPSPERDAHRRRLIELNELAATWFAQQLRGSDSGQLARDFVTRRQISDEMVQAFQLGYAPSGWENLTRVLAGRGIDEALAIEVGLIGERDSGGTFDRFRDRLIFPIRDRDGDIVGFAGRSLGDEQPKYLNSPQSSIFDKSHLLYALDRAKEEIRKEDRAIVVEGYMDVIAAHQFGFGNVVATMGTALTESQLALLKRHSKRIVLAMDADAAGQMAMVRALDALPETGGEEVPIPAPGRMVQFEKKLNIDLRVLEIPSGKDPDELIRADSTTWPEIVSAARPFLAFYIDRVTTGLDLDEPRAKSEAVAKVAPLLRLLPDRIARDHYVDQLAIRLRIGDRQALASEIRRAGASRTTAPEIGGRSGLDRSGLDLENHLLALFLRFTAATEDVRVAATPADFLDARNRTIFETVQLQEVGTGAEQLDPMLEEHASSLAESLAERVSADVIKVKSEAGRTLQKLRKDRFDHLVKELQMDIALAQREGDMNLVDELLARYGELSAGHRQFAPRESPYFRDSRSPRPMISKFKAKPTA